MNCRSVPFHRLHLGHARTIHDLIQCYEWTVAKQRQMTNGCLGFYKVCGIPSSNAVASVIASLVLQLAFMSAKH